MQSLAGMSLQGLGDKIKYLRSLHRSGLCVLLNGSLQVEKGGNDVSSYFCNIGKDIQV